MPNGSICTRDGRRNLPPRNSSRPAPRVLRHAPGSRSPTIGSTSLALDDEVDLVVDGERPGPWLANLYVVPERREQGVATALIEHVLGHADGLGIDTLWLVTDSAPELHRRFGWTAFARTTLNSWPCIVMRRG